MSTFQVLVLVGIFGGAFTVLWSLHDIAKLLAAILDEVREETEDDESL